MFLLNKNDIKIILLSKNSFLIYILIFVSFSLPFIWLHGRIIYFWDGLLPFKSSSDFYYLKFSWNQLNGLGYGISIDKFNIYIIPYCILQLLTNNMALTQYILLSVLITFSTLGMYLLLKYMASLLNKNVNYIFPFIGSLFYIFNFYFIFVFSDFYPVIYMYSLMPLSILIFSKMIESFGIVKKYVIYSIIFSLLLEIISYSFSLIPMLVFFIFTLMSYLFIFIKYLLKSKFNLLKYIKNISIFLFILATMNIWWIIQYFINYSSESASTAISGISTIVIDFTTNGYYPLKLLSTISIYPQLFPIEYENNWFWTAYYYPKFIVFPLIAIILFLIILIPLILIKNKKSIFNSQIKIRLYVVTFVILFFALQGINPINRYIFLYLKNNYPRLLVELYATRLPFMRMPLIFFYTLIFYDSIYEIYNFHFVKKLMNRKKTHRIIKKFVNIKIRAYLIVLLLVLILVVYPFYIYTPYAMQEYDTGHGNIPETVIFPKYFYNMANYINKNSNNSDTLILPLTYDMLSMNFSSGNAFSDDNYAGLLTGSPAISGQNQTLFDLINTDISQPGTNFSILLNNINVKYILVNTLFDKYTIGYPQNTNISILIHYLNNQKSVKFLKNFGPLLIYKNIFYNGIITSSNLENAKFSLYNNQNYKSVTASFKNINTTFNEKFSKYDNMSFRYNNGIKIEFKNYTSKLINNGYYFSNFKPLDINISNYHYLLITAESSKGNSYNGTYFAVDTYTYIVNGTADTSYIKPIGSSTYYQGNSSYKTYIFPLYNNPYDIDGYYNLSDGFKNNLSYVTFAVRFHVNSTFPAYLNISEIGFAKFLHSNSAILSTENITSAGLFHENVGVANITFKEINPTKYMVNINNAKAQFSIILKQNFNINWKLNGINTGNYAHFLADSYANGWLVNKTGNYTFFIVYTPQKEYNEINNVAINSNVAAFIILIPMVIYTRRWHK